MKFTNMLFVALLAVSSFAFSSEDNQVSENNKIVKIVPGFDWGDAGIKALKVGPLRLGIAEIISICATTAFILKSKSRKIDSISFTALGTLLYTLLWHMRYTWKCTGSTPDETPEAFATLLSYIIQKACTMSSVVFLLDSYRDNNRILDVILNKLGFR